MKVLLSGYEGSKFLIPATATLLKKYIPRGFDVYFLNYGDSVKLPFGKFVSLKDVQDWVKNWSKDLHEYISTLKDEYVIFALDDYLMKGKLDKKRYKKALKKIGGETVAVRLCSTDPEMINRGEYTVTTQYTIWNREVLLEILAGVNTPWEFEIQGSSNFNNAGYKVYGEEVPILPYQESSALSPSFNRLNLTELSKEDKDIVNNLV